jgi:hypothetical protein
MTNLLLSNQRRIGRDDRLRGPLIGGTAQPRRSVPPQVMKDELTRKQSSRCTVGGVLDTRNMFPVLWRDQIDDQRNSVANKGLELSRIRIQPM